MNSPFALCLALMFAQPFGQSVLEVANPADTAPSININGDYIRVVGARFRHYEEAKLFVDVPFAAKLSERSLVSQNAFYVSDFGAGRDILRKVHGQAFNAAELQRPLLTSPQHSKRKRELRLPLSLWPVTLAMVWTTTADSVKDNHHIVCRTGPAVNYVKGNQRSFRDASSNLNAFYRQVSTGLRFTHFSRDRHSFPGSFIGIASQEESPNEQAGADGHGSERKPASVLHTLRGSIHRLRSFSHSLLGDKIVLLALSAYPFAALAGFGGFIVFDDANRNPKRLLLGRLFLVFCPILAALCLLLGLQ